MDHYIEIRVLPDPEFPANHLMSALFSKLHRALAAVAEGEIGISFPDAVSDRPRLGERLRVHGSAAALDRLMNLDWLKGMRDHVSIQGPATVPETVRFRTVSRVQAHSSPERMRRRLMKRHEIDAEHAKQQIPDSAAEYLNLPYLEIRSQSTGQRFRLFVRQGLIKEASTPGRFSSYGFSDHATVPWF